MMAKWIFYSPYAPAVTFMHRDYYGCPGGDSLFEQGIGIVDGHNHSNGSIPRRQRTIFGILLHPEFGPANRKLSNIRLSVFAVKTIQHGHTESSLIKPNGLLCIIYRKPRCQFDPACLWLRMIAHHLDSPFLTSI